MNLGKPLLEELFNKQIRFRIPVFQRHYVWRELEQWQPLWEDLKNKVEERQSKKIIHPHYTGSIVLYHETTNTSTLSTYSVIDGQQRLTTFQLLIAAFREVCRTNVENDDLIKELNKFLFNEKSFSDTNYEQQKFKLEPTKFNKEVFKFIIDHTYKEVDEKYIEPVLHEYGIGPKSYRGVAKSRNRILGAYIYFYDQLNAMISAFEGEINELITTILLALKRDFQFVEIGLTHSDDPQMIFETMNGRGASLTETDLIRNFIFMRANNEVDNLDSIYDEFWDEYDDPEAEYQWHDKVSRGRYRETRLQFFVIDYLAVKMLTDIRYDQVFYNYKTFIVNNAFSTVRDELAELHRFSSIYKDLTLGVGDSAFARLAGRLKDMDMTTIYPLVLYIEADADIPRNDKNQIYGYLDSYLTRRFLCGYTGKNYNKTFIDYIKFLSKNKSAEAFKKMLLEKTSDTSIWPPDSILLDKLVNRPIYREEKNRSRSLANILLEVEHTKRTSKQETVSFQNVNLTVEHVLPQTWWGFWPLNGDSVSEEDFNLAVYAVHTEDDPEGLYHKIERRNQMLHTMGNLTLLTNSLNPSVSNGPFHEKRPEITKQSTLILNSYFYELPEWNEDRIKQRGQKLYDSIKDIWKHG